MRNPFDHPAWIDISLLLGRVSLGLYFVMAGWRKVGAEGGLSAFAHGSFKGLQPAWLPDAIAMPYAYALPVLELIFGLALMLGFFSRIAAAGILFLLTSFLVAQVVKLGPDALDDKATTSFNTNYILTALALILMVVGSGRLALDPLYAAPSGPPPKK